VLIATRQAVTHIRESQRFKSMYTLQGKPDTHVTYVFHASPPMSYARFMRVVPVCGHQPKQSWTDPTAPEKKVLRHNP
jgi:hypothetical protein